MASCYHNTTGRDDNGIFRTGKVEPKSNQLEIKFEINTPFQFLSHNFHFISLITGSCRNEFWFSDLKFM